MESDSRNTMHPAHERIWDMLPWYHNGGLDPDEAHEVELHLGECLVCGRELRRFGRLSAAVQMTAEEHACSQAFLRLSEQIRTRESRMPAWLRTAAAVLGDVFEPVPLIAGASLLVVSSVLVAVIVLTGNAELAQVEQPFQTLGHQERMTTPLSHPLFRVVLRDEPGDAGLGAWLDRHDAELVGGPSQIGVLTVKVAMGSRRFGAVLNQIRSDEETIFVEPVDLVGSRRDRRR